MRRRCRRLLLSAVAIAVSAVSLGKALPAQPGGNQGPSYLGLLPGQLADRGPRFLLATEASPIPVDVARTPLLTRRIALDLTGVSLRAALRDIARRAEIELVFSDQIVPAGRAVRLKAEAITVAAALTDVLLDSGLDVVFAPSGSATLTKREPTDAPPFEVGTIVGRVADASSREGLAGATVQIQSTRFGAVTDAEGRYRIPNIAPGTYTIVARRIGYTSATQTVTVAADQTVTADFALTTAATALDEIVVTGTAGQARRREVGNAISQIKASDLPEPVASVDNLLQGRAAGVAVVQNTGQVAGGASIRLRGNVSATMSNQPLIYVDGVRMRSDGYPKNTYPVGYAGNSDNTVYSPLNDIPPSEIERIEVIKGPAAATLYGTEAAAGVIQIFTKRGSQGATRWTFQMDQGLSRVQRFGPTQGFDGRPLTIPESEVSQYGTPDFMYLEPWLRDGWRQKYALSLGGGRDQFDYYLSGMWDDNKGVLPLDKSKQYGVRGNLSFAPRKDLTLQWNTGYTHNDVQRTPTGGTSAGITLNAFRRDRNYFGNDDPKVISQVLRFDLSSYVDHLITGVTATYTPFPTFTNRFTVGYDLAQQEARQVMPYGFVTTPKGQASDQRWSNRTFTLDYVGTVKLKPFRDFNSDFSFGAQSTNTEESSITAASRDFPGPGVPTISSGAISLGFEDRIKVINAGFFFQNVFNYKDRYFLTPGVRFDGNSAFGANLGLQAYPKVSASYIISDEPFWRASLGTLKLRAAYGHSGRAPGAFDAVRTWNPASWGGQVAFSPRNLGNPDLGPERTSELELGLDGSFFHDRLTVELTRYHRTTRDALFSVRQPPSQGGWSSQLQNVGKLQSTGLELSLLGSILRRERFGWDLGGTISTNHSKTLDLGGAAPFSLGNNGWIVVGQPVPVIRANCVTNPDEIADPVMATACMIGPNTPTLTLTGNTTLRLPAGLTLSVRGEYQGGNYAYSLMDGESITRGIRWPACFNSYPDIDAKDLSRTTARVRAMCIASNASRDLAIFPMDFFRMRDLTLQVPVPGRYLRASSAMVSLSAQNFFTWKKAKDSFLDPETSGGFTSSGMTERVHSVGGSIPIPATFVFSLRATY